MSSPTLTGLIVYRQATRRSTVSDGAPRSRTVVGDVSSNRYYWLKRAIDIFLSSILLVLLAPLFLSIAALIKLDSRGPVFFAQERVGCRRRRQGKRIYWELRSFRFMKFRSMSHGADQSVHRRHIENLRQDRTHGSPFKIKNDPRVTRTGRFLRKTSLDELPQLLNVLRGEMSLVGPRPVLPYELDYYTDSSYARFAALGGITGFWQVTGRGVVSLEEMIRMDVEYTQRISLWLDLKILFLTLPAIISGRGAE